MEKVTIKDVAREAGVSISTVSNALNGVDVLKPETKEHILEVAQRLHYIPNLNGRNLKSKETKVIGLFVTSLKGPYFVALADSIFQECVKCGYELNVFVTWNHDSAMNNILGKRVDGCIILGNAQQPQELKRIQDYEVPTVFLDREVAGKRMSSVIFDSYQAGVTAAEYFISRGAKQIGFVQGYQENYDARLRYEGFTSELKKSGITLKPEYIWEGCFEKEKAKESTKAFLEKALPIPDAIFAANDLSAIGAMEALLEAGIDIPKQTIILGVDGIEQNEWVSPSLSSIETGFEKQGSLAVKELLELINGRKKGEIIKLQGTLVERESTGKNSN